MVVALVEQIDRLMIGVYRAIGPVHGHRLRPSEEAAGSVSLGFVLDLGDFLDHGTLTTEVARLRTRYAPPGNVDDVLARLVDQGLIDGDPMRSVGPLATLIETALQARADIANSLWTDHDQTVRLVLPQLDDLIDGIGPQHPLATAHAALPTPAAGPEALIVRLVTLRYLRMDDHAAAWAEAGRTTAEMVAMASGGGPWTDERLEIERSTNERTAVSFAGVADHAALATALALLPGSSANIGPSGE